MGTNTHSVTEARAALQAMCDAQLDAAAQSELPAGGSWGSLGVDMNDYIAGQGFLNLETGNLQQEEGDFARDPDRFIYKGEDPTLNDHYPTTAESYAAGNAIKAFYDNEAKNSLLEVPTDNFVSDTDEDEETPKMCAETNAAVCCWHRDRQYFDQNGDCGSRDCANADPGDNTDLCWTEDKEGTVFPYPGSATEQDLHCHGFAWGNELEGAYDLNGNLKWNNLFLCRCMITCILVDMPNRLRTILRLRENKRCVAVSKTWHRSHVRIVPKLLDRPTRLSVSILTLSVFK